MAVIAFSASGKTLADQVDPRFGRCQYFLFYDLDQDQFKVVDNPGSKAFRGAGVAAAQLLAGQKVKAAVAGNFGPNAVSLLRASQIKIFLASGMTIKKALKQYKSGQLASFNQ